MKKKWAAWRVSVTPAIKPGKNPLQQASLYPTKSSVASRAEQ